LHSAPPPDPESVVRNSKSLLPAPLYACLHLPPSGEPARGPERPALQAIAEQFSPRYERHRDDLVSIDVSGLEQLVGPPPTIGEELRREAGARGLRAHVAVAGTRMAAMVLALARPGVTVVPRGGEAAALEHIRIEILEHIDDDDIRTQPPSRQGCFGEPRRSSERETPGGGGNSQRSLGHQHHDHSAISAVSAFKYAAIAAFKKWGLKTLGEVAALPAADLVSRLGRRALEWQAIARGDDIRPLVPTLAEERFESSLELEWPIEELEPLSFVLTRLLEPLSTRLERRDRGAAVLHVALRLITKDPATGVGHDVYARRLELPTPMRDVRALRTLALLDLESHPPGAPIDRVTIVIDPTPGRVLQHALFARAHPTPEQLSTLLARLGALMGQDRIGAPAAVDTYRPGAFAMTAFKTEHEARTFEVRSQKSEDARSGFRLQTSDVQGVASALRRCRQPVPARVALVDGRPIRVTTDRRGFAGGAVVHCSGPWRSSGDWWKSEVRSLKPEQTSDFKLQTLSWSRDEWDVALGDGAVYRIFQDRATDAWFVDAIVD
jgi:protein ImuB